MSQEYYDCDSSGNGIPEDGSVDEIIICTFCECVAVLINEKIALCPSHRDMIEERKI